MRTFVFYPEYYEAINKLKTNEDKYQLAMAIMEYGCTGNEPKIEDTSGVI